MEKPTKSTVRKPSGIPRLSRLPVRREAIDLAAEPNLESTRSNLNAAHSNIKNSTSHNTVASRSAYSTQRDGNFVKPSSAGAKPLTENDGYNALPRRFPANKMEPTGSIVKQEREPENMVTGSRGYVETQRGPDTKLATAHRRPRPSLSDRTIETLSQIPPSPSPRRRQSNFFPQEAPTRITPRPESSLSRSRPSTSIGYHPLSPTKRPTGNQPSNVTPSRRSVSSYAPKSVPHLQKGPDIPCDMTPSKVRPASPSKVATTRLAKPLTKSSIKTSSPTLIATGTSRKGPSATGNLGGLQRTSAPEGSMFPPGVSTPSWGPKKRPEEQHTPKSSAVLRESIAKAKAAQRNALKYKGKSTLDSGFEIQVDTGVSSIRKRITMALEDGKLNIAALGLKEIPEEVIKIYDYGSLESVDITKINVADNELKTISDEVFPDIDTEAALREDDDFPGLTFGALESLDLHGNQLTTLPRGFRRLDNLTTLNLSKNCLIITNLETIAEMESLRELRLAENALAGTFPRSLCGLRKLEFLDLHDNAITDIPGNLEEMHSLSNLNVSGNQLVSLPWNAISSIPLTELDASRNKLRGPVFPLQSFTLTTLKFLSIASNALTSLTSTVNLTLPAIQTLDISFNRLKSLPDISTCTAMTTLSASNNQLSGIPDDLVTLPQLRTVDLSYNGIRAVEKAIGYMDGLKMLNLAGNPLRQGEKRFLGLETEEMKRELRGRDGGGNEEE